VKVLEAHANVSVQPIEQGRPDNASGLHEGSLDLTLDSLKLPGPGDYEFSLKVSTETLFVLPFGVNFVQPPLMQ
jgi:hypothetical protein